jgi:formylglycine-generating enzyme required for sulfatase activity
MKRFLFLLFYLVSLPCAAEVQPPEKPLFDKEIGERDVRPLLMLTQPPELKAALEAIAQGPIQERVARLKKKALEDMVFVEGGLFMMDFLKHRHPVRLTSYSISRYKVTYAEFDTYTDATNTPRTAEDPIIERVIRQNSFIPAGAFWQRARDYCQWVGKLTGLPFDLPTEAQWEYAARSRGKYFVFATDTGNIEHGRNVPGADEHYKLLNPMNNSGFRMPIPIGLFPPNPLGLYDLGHNGFDWVLDWYDPNYYRHLPIDNPQGPDSGTEKVVRGGISMSMTIVRWESDPQLKYLSSGVMKQGPVTNYGLRCVVNTPQPLPKP